MRACCRFGLQCRFAGQLNCVAGVVLSASGLCVSASMCGGEPAHRDDYPQYACVPASLASKNGYDPLIAHKTPYSSQSIFST